MPRTLTSSSTSPPTPWSCHAWDPTEDDCLGSLAFHFHDTLGLLMSLPEVMTMVQNVQNYILHMSHQTGTSLLVLSIYFDRNWKTYNERLCFLTSYLAPSHQGYFFLQFDIEYSQVPRLSKSTCIWSHIPTMQKWLFSFILLPIKTHMEEEVQERDRAAP